MLLLFWYKDFLNFLYLLFVTYMLTRAVMGTLMLKFQKQINKFFFSKFFDLWCIRFGGIREKKPFHLLKPNYTEVISILFLKIKVADATDFIKHMEPNKNRKTNRTKPEMSWEVSANCSTSPSSYQWRVTKRKLSSFIILERY